MRLKDKVALITGAGGGIGREPALLFAKDVAAIVVIDVNNEAGNNTVEMVSSQKGRAVYVHADVSKAADCEQMVAVAEKGFGKLDVCSTTPALCITPTTTPSLPKNPSGI